MNNREQRAEEYYKYVVLHYEIGDIIEMYKIYLMNNPISVPLWDNEYNDPTSFLYYFDRQCPQYVDVFNAIEDQNRLYIVGDGPGTGSIAAWITDRQYLSQEPNDIGKIAKKIGIIKEGLPKKDDIIVLFNVLEYIKVEKWTSYDRVIIVDENFDKKLPGFFPHSDGAGRVFYKGIKMGPLVMFPLQNNRYMFDKYGAVNPEDYKSEVMAILMKIKIDKKKGFKVNVTKNKGMNIVTRNDMLDTRAKKEGSFKNIKKIVKKVYPGKNIIFTHDGMIVRFYNDYKTIRFTDNYYFNEGFYYVRTLRPRMLQYIKLRGMKETVRVYMVKSVIVRGITYGVYKDFRDMVTLTDMADDIVETNRGIVNMYDTYGV